MVTFESPPLLPSIVGMNFCVLFSYILLTTKNKTEFITFTILMLASLLLMYFLIKKRHQKLIS